MVAAQNHIAPNRRPRRSSRTSEPRLVALRWQSRALISSVFALMTLSAASAQAELKSWVDADGNVHVVDDTAPDLVDIAAETATKPTTDKRSRADSANQLQYTYRWLDRTGRVQITDGPPHKSGRLLSRSASPRTNRTATARVKPNAVRTATSVLKPEANVVRAIARLRLKGRRGVPLPRIVSKTAAGTDFDSAMVSDRPMWVAFVTMTCRHCRIEADLMQQISGEFEPQTFVVVVKGDHRAAIAFAEATRMDPSSVVALPPGVFPDGPVPFNVVVGDDGLVERTLTGRLPTRAFKAMARRVLR